MTQKPLKIWHINNIAEVGRILTEGLRKAGVDAEFFDIPKPFSKHSLWVKFFGTGTRFRGAQELIKRAEAAGVDALHVHYTTAALWFVWGRIPVIIHAHGCDVRLEPKSPVLDLVNKVVLPRARTVLYSTPDLRKWIDRAATFLPNPMDLDLFYPRDVKRDPHLIFLHLQLQEIKGAPMVLAAVRTLKSRHPHLRFQAVAIGEYVEEARAAGVEVLPRQPREKLPEILSSAGFILGQVKVGAIGMSELEVLALGRTVCCHFEYDDVYAEAPPFVKARTEEEIVAAVERYLEDPKVYSDLESRARTWLERFHDRDSVCAELAKMYESMGLREDSLTRDRQPEMMS
ncbi:MAG: glycosyltransferase [Bdellovibrionales bacterium]